MAKKIKNINNKLLLISLFVSIIAFINFFCCVAAKTTGIEGGGISPKVENKGPVGKQQNSVVSTGGKKTNNSGVIQNSGAGWVVIGCAIVILLFFAFILMFFWIILRNRTSALKLLTFAVQGSAPDIRDNIKEKINYLTSNGGPYGDKDKKNLSKFVKSRGLDAK